MPLNDCLSLFPAQALNRQELNAGWRMAIATLGEGEDRGFSRTDFDDDPWAPVQVPRLHGATSGSEAIWYRVRFPRPRHRQRTLLRFEGAFLVANVWLNGRLLGSHYGYFAPFSFDISSFLLEENVLAICIEAPVETDLAAKRHLMGLFSDSETKPYPSREQGRLGRWGCGVRCCSSRSATSSRNGFTASPASSRAISPGSRYASGCATSMAGS